MRYYEVVGWSDFQHYKAERPGWIKNYVKVQDNIQYRRLPDVSKAHLHGLWLVAARLGNVIPDDQEEVGALMGAKEPVDFGILVSAGFIRPCNILKDSAESAESVRVEVEKSKREIREEHPAREDPGSGPLTRSSEDEHGNQDIHLHVSQRDEPDGGGVRARDRGAYRGLWGTPDPVGLLEADGRESERHLLLLAAVAQHNHPAGGGVETVYTTGREMAEARNLAGTYDGPALARIVRGMKRTFPHSPPPDGT